MTERQGKGMTLLADDRTDCCTGGDISYIEKGGNRMFEGQGEAMALPTDQRMCRCLEVKGKAPPMPAYKRICCEVEVSRKNRQQSVPGRFSWYFAKGGMPDLIYTATMNGYVASGPDKPKGGKENV